MRLLPLPELYQPENARSFAYRPDINRLAEEAARWKKLHQIKPAGSDEKIVTILNIDNQKDFGFPEGALYVSGRSGTGAMDDAARFAVFVYGNLAGITNVRCTLDSHILFQLFHPCAFLTQNGEFVPPATQIFAADLQAKTYTVNPAFAKQLEVPLAWLERQVIYYCDELERLGKPPLMIWPYHCLIGSEGHALMGVIDEVRLFHSLTRGARNAPEVKGLHPLYEQYGIFMGEVMTDFTGRPLPGAYRNVELIKQLTESDMIIIAGQAASHCVATSIDQLLSEIQTQDPSLVKKVYILEDCTSAVVIPGVIDFTDMAVAAFDRFRDAGMHVVRGTEPDASSPTGMRAVSIADWPDSPIK